MYLAFWLLPVWAWILFPYFSPGSLLIRKYNLRLPVCEHPVLSLLDSHGLMLLICCRIKSDSPEPYWRIKWIIGQQNTQPVPAAWLRRYMLQTGNQKARNIEAKTKTHFNPCQRYNPDQDVVRYSSGCAVVESESLGSRQQMNLVYWYEGLHYLCWLKCGGEWGLI